MFRLDLCDYSGLCIITASFTVLPAVVASHAPRVELAHTPPEHLAGPLTGQDSCFFSALPSAGLLKWHQVKCVEDIIQSGKRGEEEPRAALLQADLIGKS